MQDLDTRLREELARSVDSGVLGRLDEVARTNARRTIARRRIGIGTGVTAAAAAVTALALTLGGGAPSGATGTDVRPAAAPTTTAAARTSTTATTPSSAAPNLGTPVPLASRTTPAPGQPAGDEWYATDLLAPAPTGPLQTDHGYYAHPELVRPGEPPVWGAEATPFTKTDPMQANVLRKKSGSTDLRAFPRVLLDPSGGPFPDLRLFDYGGAFEGYACAEVGPQQTLTPVAHQSSTYISRSAFGAGDGDLSPTIDRSSADVDLSQYGSGVDDLVAARVAGRGSCPEYWQDLQWAKPTPVAATVAGSDRATMVHLGQSDIYRTFHSVLFAQRGRYVVTVHGEGRTQADADAIARWFAEQALTKVPNGGTR